METLRSMTRLERRLMLALLGCVLVARMMVPAGWMPMVDRGGHVSLALCSGMGPVEMKAMPGMAGKAPAHQDQGDHPCVGAGVIAGLATAEITAPPSVFARHAPPPALARLAVSVGRGLAAPPPPPTGPPSLV